jgi:hypothetical protein
MKSNNKDICVEESQGRKGRQGRRRRDHEGTPKARDSDGTARTGALAPARQQLSINS